MGSLGTVVFKSRARLLPQDVFPSITSLLLEMSGRGENCREAVALEHSRILLKLNSKVLFNG